MVYPSIAVMFVTHLPIVLVAQGLDPSTVVSEGVDGDLLLSLAYDDFKHGQDG